MRKIVSNMLFLLLALSIVFFGVYGAVSFTINLSDDRITPKEVIIYKECEEDTMYQIWRDSTSQRIAFKCWYNKQMGNEVRKCKCVY